MRTKEEMDYSVHTTRIVGSSRVHHLEQDVTVGFEAERELQKHFYNLDEMSVMVVSIGRTLCSAWMRKTSLQIDITCKCFCHKISGFMFDK